MKFKDLKPGLFRDHGIVYCKFENVVEQKIEQNDAQIFNASLITSGKLVFYTDDKEIEEY